MATSGNGLNGGANRLDQIERLLRRSIEENQAAHKGFRKRLERLELNSLERYRRKLLTAHLPRQDRTDRPDELVNRIERNLAEAGDKFKALGALMDSRAAGTHPRPEQESGKKTDVPELFS